MRSRYTLTEPCSNCPFRADTDPFPLRPERVQQIGEAVLRGEEFWCHKTMEYDADAAESSEMLPARTRVCAGAVATLAREGQSPTMMQVTKRLGLPATVPDPDAPVYGSVAEWMSALGAPAPPQPFRRTRT